MPTIKVDVSRIKRVFINVNYSPSFGAYPKEKIEYQAIREVGLEISKKLFEFNKVISKEDEDGNFSFSVSFDVIVPETPEKNLTIG